MIPPEIQGADDALFQFALDDAALTDALHRTARVMTRGLGIPVVLVTLFGPGNRQRIRLLAGTDRALPEASRFLELRPVPDDGLLLIPDCAADQRVAEDVWVREWGLRSFAAAPIRSTEHPLIGLLCALDTAPCRYNADRQAVLRDLALSIADIVLLRHTAVLRRQILQRDGEAHAGPAGADSAAPWFTLDARGRLTAWNPAFERMIGHPADALRDRPVETLLPLHDEAASLHTLLGRVFRRRRFAGPVFVFEAAGGQTRHVRLRLAPVYDDARAVCACLCTCEDVTRLQDSEERLEAAVRQFQALLDAVPDTVLLIRSDGTGYTLSTPASAARRPLVLNEPAPLRDVLPGVTADHLLDGVRRALENKRIETLAFTEQTADGVRYCTAYAAPCPPGAALVVVRDQTEHRDARHRLAEYRARYRVVSELTTDFAYSLYVHPDDGMKVEWMTGGFERLTGYTPSGFERLGWKEVLHPDDLAPFEQRLRSQRRSQTHLAEYRLKAADGTYRWISDSGRIVPGARGGLRIFGAARDITERVEYEESLIEARERAEEIARLKSSLLSNLSHEIRTPIASIIGFADILQDLLVDEHREFAELIEQSGQRLMDMLTALLDLTALEADTLEIHPQVVDLVDLALNLGERFRPQFEEKGLVLDLAMPDEAPTLAFLDPDAQRRVLTNLLDNALKFTQEGRVTLAVAVDTDWATVSVRDTGIGISPRFLPHLFDEFRQESTGLARQFEGNGLGLSITRQLVERMGGSIEVESEKNRGSLFTVRYPRIVDPAPDGRTRRRPGRSVDARAPASGP